MIRHFFSTKKYLYFSYFSSKIYVVGTQSKRLAEALLLSTNICFRREIKKNYLPCLFVLRFYSPVKPMGSCRARSIYLTWCHSWSDCKRLSAMTYHFYFKNSEPVYETEYMQSLKQSAVQEVFPAYVLNCLYSKHNDG